MASVKYMEKVDFEITDPAKVPEEFWIKCSQCRGAGYIRHIVRDGLKRVRAEFYSERCCDCGGKGKIINYPKITAALAKKCQNCGGKAIAGKNNGIIDTTDRCLECNTGARGTVPGKRNIEGIKRC